MIYEMTKAWAERSGVQLWSAEEVESTNDVAKSDIGGNQRSPLAPVLYITRHQSKGRGRGQNTWTDSSGALLSSWSFNAVKAPQPIFAPLAGLAVYRALSAVWPTLAWSMKAPNDIFLGDKKVAGLLIETIETGTSRRAVIGLGLNVQSSPSDVETATSLSVALGSPATQPITQSDWATFLQKVLLGFMSALNAGQNTSLLQNDSKDLLAALNRRPNLPEPIVKIGPQGELHTATGVIRWQDL